MSASVNRVELLGNLGADPEVKNLAGDRTVATFRLATNKEWKDKDGQVQTKTTWHNVEVWGAQAKTCGQFLTKGRQVLIHGELAVDQWEKDGQKQSKTKVVSDRVIFLGGSADREAVLADLEPGACDVP